MLDPDEKSGANVEIELNAAVMVDINDRRGKCWMYDVNNQFPVIPSNASNGKMTVEVDAPHKGYSIQTTLINGKLNGTSRIVNEKNVVVAVITFVNGVANGPCTLYDNIGKIFYEGNMENGYRQGKGKEYDEDGNLIYDGDFYQGKRQKSITPMKGMKGYWKELSDENKLISICRLDQNSRNDGICYFYTNGCISRISEWKNGEEVNVLKQFEDNKMIEYEKGVKRYEGEFRNSIKHNYPREGRGEEYDPDGKSLIYHGLFWNGKRQGKGIAYHHGRTLFDGVWLKGYQLNGIVWSSIGLMAVFVILAFLLSLYSGIILCVVDIILWIVLWFCFPSIRSTLCRRDSISKEKTLHIKDDIAIAQRLNYLIIWILIIVILNAVLIYPLSMIFVEEDLTNKCLGYSSGTSMVIESNRCNEEQFTEFSMHPNPDLRSVVVGDHCFENVNTFKIDGLERLRLLIIGIDSFTKSLQGIDSSRSFQIENCEELDSIEIGYGSFSDYSIFELKNLPLLSSIQIGEIGRDSFNFYHSSFTIKGS